MDKAEYEKIMKEAAEQRRRTSFPALEQDREARYYRAAHHAEYGASRH